MYVLMQVLKDYGVNRRSYTDRQGQQQVITSRGFALSDGINTIYAEAVGPLAEQIQVVEGETHAFLLTYNHRTYIAQDGALRHSNDVQVLRFG